MISFLHSNIKLKNKKKGEANRYDNEKFMNYPINISIFLNVNIKQQE